MMSNYEPLLRVVKKIHKCFVKLIENLLKNHFQSVLGRFGAVEARDLQFEVVVDLHVNVENRFAWIIDGIDSATKKKNKDFIRILENSKQIIPQSFSKVIQELVVLVLRVSVQHSNEFNDLIIGQTLEDLILDPPVGWVLRVPHGNWLR